MGNICRSPSAEAIFTSKVREAGLDASVSCDSAGTISYHTGNRADGRMRAAATKRGYSLESIARQIEPGDFEKFDHILAMDRDNLRDIQAMRPANSRAEVSLMCDFAHHIEVEEVPDPYYGGASGFERVLDILEDACDGLLEDITRRSRSSSST